MSESFKHNANFFLAKIIYKKVIENYYHKKS